MDAHQFLCGVLALRESAEILPSLALPPTPGERIGEESGGSFAPENRPKCRFFVYQNDTFSQNRMGKYMAKNEKCGKYR